MKPKYRSFTNRSVRWVAFGAALSALWLPMNANAQYQAHNLVSDGAVPADVTDTHLVNPWGIAYSPTGPFWIADNGSHVATVYGGDGSIKPLVVSIPPGGASAPTGQVYNGSNGFLINGGGLSAPARFIFSSEDGIISGWNPSVSPTNSVTAVDNSASGAKYKGLALGVGDQGSTLFATNFNSGNIDLFNPAFGSAGTATDPNMPVGYAPFGAQALNDKVYVTYALRGPTGDDVAGLGHGFVDVFNSDGTFDKRLVSQGLLDSPWGLAIAPSSYGAFAGDLLVGNFGDGHINVYDPNSGAFEGTLMGSGGNPLVIHGLWALTVGNGAGAGSKGSVYFTAGINDEADGLFGRLDPVPEPASMIAMVAGIGALGLRRRSKR